MFNKAFTALSFSSGKLQLVKLNSSKTKSERYLTVDLPNGLIKDHKVQDKDALAQFLKQVWLKAKIKEKAVGIVVPEFSTFIKNLELPKLSGSELDEAVLWQARDFLPKNLYDMSFDWKVTRRLEESIQVLALAIDKTLLAGYVDAAGTAGLFPLVVETPSVSLARLSEGSDEGRMIVYGHFDEVILVVTEGSKILGSSVVSAKNVDELNSTAHSILTHYKDIKVVKILIGGLNLNQEVVKKLEVDLGIPVNRLSLEIQGINPEDLQAYLIPVSLSLKEPTEPADEDTINLLPKKLVDKYKRKRASLQVWSLMMIVTFLIWSSFFAVVGTYIFMAQQASSLKAEMAGKLSQVQESQETLEKIQEINTTSADIIRISRASFQPQTILNLIFDAKPEGVILRSYKLDLDKGLINISGISATRGDLINFKQKLDENDDFAQISIPISSFEVETNLNFELSIAYLPIIKIK